MSESALTSNPLLLCLEMSGRLLPYYEQFPNIKHLVNTCDLAAQKNTLLVPNWQTHTAPGKLLYHYLLRESGRLSYNNYLAS